MISKYKFKKALENTKKAIISNTITRLDIEDLEEGDIVYTMGANKYTFVGLIEETDSKEQIEVINAENKTIKLSTKTPLYNVEVRPKDKIEGRLEDVLSLEVMEDLIENGINAEDFFKYQAYILEEFENLKKHGDQVFKQLMASKQGTEGAGRNFTEANITYENWREVYYDNKY